MFRLYHKHFNNCFICTVVKQPFFFKFWNTLINTPQFCSAPLLVLMLGLKICKCSVEHNCILNKVPTAKCIWIQLKQLQVYCVWWGREVEEDTQWSHLGLELPPPPTQRHTGFVFCIHFRNCISIWFVYFYLFLCIKSNAHTYRFVLFSTMKLLLNMIFLVLSPSHHLPFICSWTVKYRAQNTRLLDVHWLLWYPPHQKSGFQMNFTCWAEGQQES